MEKGLEIFAKRLQQARIKAKLSMEKLSTLMSEKADVKVTKQAISKYEKALMMPSSTVQIAMAEILNVDHEYFHRPFRFNIDDLNISFRKKADTTVGDQRALEIQIQDQVERYLEIEDILRIKPRTILKDKLVPIRPLESNSDMVLMAKTVREFWSLGKAPIANTQELLEALGIKVLLTPAPSGFLGVSGIINDKYWVIVLNSSDPYIERRRLTTLHELCHLLYNSYFSNQLSAHEKERLCNTFANEMLLPGVILKNLFKGKSQIAIEELISVSKNFGISIDAIVFKLKELDIIGEKRYRNYFIRKNSYPNFKERVERPRYKEDETTRFQAMVYSALSQELISTSKAASLLGASINNVRKNAETI